MHTNLTTLQEIRCPICRRKLMNIRRNTPTKHLIEPLSKDKEYLAETRCPSCKSFVGINA